MTPEQLARLDALPDATLELSGTFNSARWADWPLKPSVESEIADAMAAGFVPMSDAIARWLLFVPQELIDDTVCFNAYLAEVYRTTIGRIPGYPAERQQYARLPVPDLDITEKPDRSEPEPDEVRSLMQGFAAARRPGCPYADVFGESPPGCRCAWCYHDGSGQ